MPTEIVGTMAVSGGQKQTALLMPGAYPAERITHQSVSVTADGVKTLQTLLNELYALIDSSKVSGRTYIEYKKYIYTATYLIIGDTYQFTCSTLYNSKFYIQRLTPRSGNNSGADTYNGTTYTDIKTSVPTNGDTITLHY